MGKEPKQQRFTVHHDFLVQRSEFFKAARSSSWTQADEPNILDDHDPEDFSTYLHCLYFGVEGIKDRISSIAETHHSTHAMVTDAGRTSSSGDDDSDSDSTGNEAQNRQQDIQGTTQTPSKKLAVLVDGEEMEPTTNLFVGNLNAYTQESTLKGAFVEFGELRSVHVIAYSGKRFSEGCGYVELTSAESAVNAFHARNGYQLHGRSLGVKFAAPRPGNLSSQDQQREDARDQTNKNSYGTADDPTGDSSAKQRSSIDYDTSYGEENDDAHDVTTRVLVKLYVLADKLIDSHATNLVIDELVDFIDSRPSLPGAIFVNIVYNCTPSGSPLRVLFRDWYVHEGFYIWDESDDLDSYLLTF